MTKPDPETTEKIKRNIKVFFQHTDLKHEAIRELANLYFQQEADKPPAEIPNAAAVAAAPEPGDTQEDSPPAAGLDTLLKTEIKLPSLPTIFSQIIDLMSDPNSDADDFSKVISADPSLTARLLKIVNSAFYGYRSRIDTISHAVMVIGTSELYSLCLSTSVLTMFKTIPPTLVDMTSFWMHSIGCGMIAKKIAARRGEISRERFFVAGLLHDIGRLIIYSSMPDQAHRVIARAARKNELLYDTEKAILGFDHGEIGGRLLQTWRLPGKLADVIRFHHHPDHSMESLETAIIHLADIMVNAVKLGSSGERFVPPLDPVAWKTVKLPVEMLSEIMEETLDQIGEIASLLIPHKQKGDTPRHY